MEMKKAHELNGWGTFLIVLGVIAPFINKSGGLITTFILVSIGIYLKALANKTFDNDDIQDRMRMKGYSRNEAELEVLKNKKHTTRSGLKGAYDSRISQLERSMKDTRTPEELYKEFRKIKGLDK